MRIYAAAQESGSVAFLVSYPALPLTSCACGCGYFLTPTRHSDGQQNHHAHAAMLEEDSDDEDDDDDPDDSNDDDDPADSNVADDSAGDWGWDD